MQKRQFLRFLGLVALTGLTGCFSSVRRVPKVQMQAPESYRTATAEQLEGSISKRDAAIQTMQASVLVTATTGGEQTGKEKTYTSFSGYIFLQKPRMLRVILVLPVIKSKAMDMVSTGTEFTLVIPPRSMAYMGTDQVTKPSANGLENLRPSVFLDSLLVPGVAENEDVTLTEATRVVEAPKGRKAGVEEPDYELLVQKPRGPKTLQLERVVHLSRVDLLPFQQDVYDADGLHVVTQATYENYQPAGSGQESFPRTITISRPLDQYTLRIDVTKLTLNPQFEADQFEAPKIPATYKIVRMQ